MVGFINSCIHIRFQFGYFSEIHYPITKIPIKINFSASSNICKYTDIQSTLYQTTNFAFYMETDHHILHVYRSFSLNLTDKVFYQHTQHINPRLGKSVCELTICARMYRHIRIINSPATSYILSQIYSLKLHFDLLNTLPHSQSIHLHLTVFSVLARVVLILHSL